MDTPQRIVTPVPERSTPAADAPGVESAAVGGGAPGHQYTERAEPGPVNAGRDPYAPDSIGSEQPQSVVAGPSPGPSPQPGEAAPPPPQPPAVARRGDDRRRPRWGLIALGVVLIGFVIGAAAVPLPYYALRPGAVRDTEALISVNDTETFPSDGTISYTTVSLRQATLFGLLSGWIDQDVDVLPDEEVLGDRNAAENRQFNLELMDNSKQVATQVALEHLGYDVSVTASGETIVSVSPGMPAEGVLEVGDVIVAVDGERIDEPGDLSTMLGDNKPGDRVTVTIDPFGAGPERSIELTLAPAPDDAERGVMGVEVHPRDLDYEFPIDVEIDSGDVGGPSAGLAFTLGLLDDLTPGDLTGGVPVAVTGTIEEDGTVGPVGGTGQKAAAVRDAGIDVFLVPSADFEAAEAHAGDVEVIKVDTLDDALAALAEFGGNGLALPRVGETDPTQSN